MIEGEVLTTIAEGSHVATESEKLVYFFSGARSDGSQSLRNLLGGKGSALAEMSSLGIPVPPGFTITTNVCNSYYNLGKTYPERLDFEVRESLIEIEDLVGSRFGDSENPLLVSVRSGARVSMPGMMDTILNLGLNDVTVEGLAKQSGDARFAYDSYRRLVQMYGDVVLGVGKREDTDTDPYEELLEAKKHSRGVVNDTDLDAAALKELVGEYKELIRDRGGEFPEDPWVQLWGAIGSVFESWENPRAVFYRDQYGYPSSWGTAVNVQAMVFGNLGDDCATGVLFTRNPSTGERQLFGECLINAQGEDVVAGIRTPQPITAAESDSSGLLSLEEMMPEVYEELASACDRLERHFQDMQDIEFTVQQGKLWILQTRSGKRSGRAMLKIAVDLADEHLMTEREALMRLEPEQLEGLLHPVFEDGVDRHVIAKGLPASPGAAVGRVVFRPVDVVEASKRGESTILVRDETSPEDIEGMVDARGILTARGGMTSHAAVVARGMGKCCVVGSTQLQIDYTKRQFSTLEEGGESVTVREGDIISLDGSTGEVMLGDLALATSQFPPEFNRVMEWVDAARRMKVRANADTPEDAKRAREFGAEGIGLCRTEHMFFGSDRILAVRQMILSEGAEARRDALAKILPMQRDDFIGILRAMAPYPVTIRLLDPPLHEFLPNEAEEINEVAAALELPSAEVTRRVDLLREQNPMLGHRGVRLGVTSPEIYEVQVRAVIEGACELANEGVDVTPEIMIPLVGMPEELRLLRERAVNIAEQVMREQGIDIDYSIGTMIELPRACVIANQIAEHADFFSFGTNDLTQTTFGLSRDDANRFLPFYLEQHLLEVDPFVQVDREGVGGLIKLGIERGKSVREHLKIGVCGEHGGDPVSIEFFEQQGFDYISCSPYRVPIARLAAAQSTLKA